jgi:hypothetical protein
MKANTTARPFETRYMKGEELELMLTDDVQRMLPYERHEWGSRILRRRKIPVRGHTYVVLANWGGMRRPTVARIVTTDYKPEAYT